MTDAPLILVVDDIEDNRYALTRRLKREGYERVIEATNGREALVAFPLQPPGERIAIVLDVVDDQDQRRIGHGAPRASNSCILASSRSISMGLVS